MGRKKTIEEEATAVDEETVEAGTADRVVARGALVTRRGVRPVGSKVQLVEISGGLASWNHLIEQGFIK